MTNEINQGHRKRLKDKFLEHPDSMLEYELLELILFYAIPRKDVKTLAKTLLNDFGSLTKLFNANKLELLKYDNITENTYTLLKLIKKSHSFLLLKEIKNKHIITNWSDVLDYCYSELAFEKNEFIKILYLNSKNYVIKEETLQEGTINYVNINLREIIKKNLEIGAMSFILIHNHPSGDFNPSREDIEITLKLAKIGANLNITLHDHIIISKQGAFSFKNSNLL